MKHIVFVVLALTLLASCSRTITDEQYIGAMAALGCKGAGETTPQGTEILKAQGVTLEQIQAFRKHVGDPRKMMPVATEIAKRVMACYGVLAPGQKIPTTELPASTPPAAPKAP